MGTFIGMSKLHKDITTALKQLPMCHTSQKLNLNHTTLVNPKYTMVYVPIESENPKKRIFVFLMVPQEVPIESENPKIQRHHKPRVPKYHTYHPPKGTIGPAHPSISSLDTKLHSPDTLPPFPPPPEYPGYP